MRNYEAIRLKLVITLIFALITAALFSGKSKHDYFKIVDTVGLIFFITWNQAFSNVSPVIGAFLGEKPVITKELAGNAYPLSAYYLSKVFSELPFDILNPLIFILVTYFLVGLQVTAVKFLNFLFIFILESLCATFLGYCVAAIAPDVEVG